MNNIDKEFNRIEEKSIQDSYARQIVIDKIKSFSNVIGINILKTLLYTDIDYDKICEDINNFTISCSLLYSNSPCNISRIMIYSAITTEWDVPLDTFRATIRRDLAGYNNHLKSSIYSEPALAKTYLMNLLAYVTKWIVSGKAPDIKSEIDKYLVLM